MICQKCGKAKASLAVKQKIKGQERIYQLCDRCAEESGFVTGSTPDPWDSLFESFFSGPSLFGYPAGSMRRSSRAPLTCPFCHETEEELLETGLLGCPSCYDTFASRLTPVFSRLHGHTRHRSAPDPLPEAGANGDLILLKEDLARAVRREDYEEAARLRDAIRGLEAGKEMEDRP